MLKRLALGIVVLILFVGLVFIGLNILDINEDYRIYLPIAVLNTVFISAIAILVASIAAANYIANGKFELLGLGCGVLAFGVSSLLKGWLIDRDMYLLITVHDYSALIAAAMHLVGAALCMVSTRLVAFRLGQKQRTLLLFLCYLGALASIALIILLAVQDVIPLLGVSPGMAILRDVIRGITTVLFIACSLIYIRINSQSHVDFYYWYSLGLMLFAFGVIFISQGAVESLIAWWGRAAQYIGGLFFVYATVGAGRLVHANRKELPLKP
ncbi:MAG TPA: hypothetical protein G4O09_00215 [Dehalococcoidia bacterium]|nr:hypothetical protein [Dehalococcoidia bacterium]